jgi:hypothetical protein
MKVVVSRRYNPKLLPRTRDRRKQAADAGPPTTMIELMLSLKISREMTDVAANELRGLLKHESRLPPGYFLDEAEAFERVGSLCDRLANALRKLNDRSRYHLSVVLYEDELMVGFIRTLESIAEETKIFEDDKCHKRAANRPAGTIEQPLLQELVSILVRAAEKYGGKLTLSRGRDAHKPIGSLPNAIAFISTLLPHQKIKIPSFKTLDRMRKVAFEECRGAVKVAKK